jgi:hypothetical protein
LLCIEMPAALLHFGVVILIQIGVERNKRVVEKIALDPDPRRVAQDLVAGNHCLIDASEHRYRGGYWGWQGTRRCTRPRYGRTSQHSAAREFINYVTHETASMAPLGFGCA